MGKLVLKLCKDPKTGIQELQVEYESDGDRLPFEHEEEHRRIVQKILGKTNLESEETKDLQIDRNPVTEPTKEPAQDSQSSRENPQSNRAPALKS